MPTWDTYALFLLLVVALQVAYILIVRTFPQVLGGALLKSLDHRNAEKLETLKNELSLKSSKELEKLRTDYQTLRDSTEYLAANQTELRTRMIAAAELLWNDMLAMREDFGSLIAFETIFLPEELADAFGRGAHPQILHFVDGYRDEPATTAKLMTCVRQDSERARLFVGDKLWLTYYVFRAILCRIAYMTNLSFKEKKYRDWRTDEPSLNLLATTLTRKVVDEMIASGLPALSLIIGQLEAHFLAESMRIMSGSKIYADSIADVHSTMAYQTARAKAEAGL